MTGAAEIAAGFTSTLVLASNGTAFGSGTKSHIGLESGTYNTFQPIMTGIKAMANCNPGIMLLHRNGTVYTAGKYPSLFQTKTPTPVVLDQVPNARIKAIACSAKCAHMITEDGALYERWGGWNLVMKGVKASACSSGYTKSHEVILAENSTVYARGDNDRSQ